MSNDHNKHFYNQNIFLLQYQRIIQSSFFFSDRLCAIIISIKKTMVSQDQIEYAMINFTRKFEEYQNTDLSLQNYSDGWIFTTILHTASHFKLSFNQLIQKPDKWTFKFNNLKKIIAAIEEYFENQLKKVILTKDIDLIEISKNNNSSELVKFFQLIVAVITQAPNKQDHIGTIMSLDERSQTIFVQIIQNLLQNRISEPKQEPTSKIISQLHLENQQLRSQMELIIKQNVELEKQMNLVRQRNQDYEEQLEKLRGKEYEKDSLGLEEPKQRQHLKNMIENLKDKLYYTAKESEQKNLIYREQINILESKLIKFEQMEEELMIYKKKYSETIQSMGKEKSWERQKIRLSRMLQQKQDIIRKLQEKIDETNELNYSMQEKQIYMKMELQKRDVRFKQLQKQVKKKFESSAPTSMIDSSFSSNQNIGILGNQLNQFNQQELDQLRAEAEKSKKRIREVERQNNKLKRNMQRIFTIQNDKKRLEKLIVDVNKDKLDQVDLLLQSMYELFIENQNMRSILNQKQIAY